MSNGLSEWHIHLGEDILLAELLAAKENLACAKARLEAIRKWADDACWCGECGDLNYAEFDAAFGADTNA